jgi:hypothetical protein
LTGLGKKRKEPCRVAIEHNPEMHIFVLISALQESEIMPDQFVNDINEKGFENVLVPLRISGSRGFPDGYEYINAFHNANDWEIIQIVVLGERFEIGKLPAGLPNPLIINLPLENPANQSASNIRHLWGWL